MRNVKLLREAKIADYKLDEGRLLSEDISDETSASSSPDSSDSAKGKKSLNDLLSILSNSDAIKSSIGDFVTKWPNTESDSFNFLNDFKKALDNSSNGLEVDIVRRFLNDFCSQEWVRKALKCADLLDDINSKSASLFKKGDAAPVYYTDVVLTTYLDCIEKFTKFANKRSGRIYRGISAIQYLLNAFTTEDSIYSALSGNDKDGPNLTFNDTKRNIIGGASTSAKGKADFISNKPIELTMSNINFINKNDMPEELHNNFKIIIPAEKAIEVKDYSTTSSAKSNMRQMISVKEDYNEKSGNDNLVACFNGYRLKQQENLIESALLDEGWGGSGHGADYIIFYSIYHSGGGYYLAAYDAEASRVQKIDNKNKDLIQIDTSNSGNGNIKLKPCFGKLDTNINTPELIKLASAPFKFKDFKDGTDKFEEKSYQLIIADKEALNILNKKR